MPSDDLRAYMDRIGYTGTADPTIETLRGMMWSHFLSVPFENLDIQRKVPILVDRRVNFEKIVGRRRGGFCLELNGLFVWALREIGFDVDVLGAIVPRADGFRKPMTHMTLLVHLDERWLVDVGFGGRVTQPVRLDERGTQTHGARTAVVGREGELWTLTTDDPWLAPGAPRTYEFTLQPRQFVEFEEACEWLQTSPESSFTKGDVVSLGRANGRITYSTGKLTVAEGESRQEYEVRPEEEALVLAERFGMRL